MLIPVGVLGTLQLFRDELLPPETAEKYKLLVLVGGLSWYWWLIILLVTILFIVLESSYRVIRSRQTIIDNLTKRHLTAIFYPKKPCRSEEQFRFSDGRNPQNGMVYRIEVENIGSEDISACVGFLTEVAFEDEAVELSVFDLLWSGSYPQPLRLDLKPTVKKHLDFIIIYENGSVSVVSHGWPPNNRENFFSRRGYYRFTIVIGGHNVTLDPYKLRLNYTGDWQTSTMELI